MFQITLTPNIDFMASNVWKEFEAITEYVFCQFKGDTSSLTELAVALDRAYRDKNSLFYPVHLDGAILVHLKEDVSANGWDDLGVPQFTITKKVTNG